MLLFFSVIITSNFQFSPQTVNTVILNSFLLLCNTTISLCPSILVIITLTGEFKPLPLVSSPPFYTPTFPGINSSGWSFFSLRVNPQIFPRSAVFLHGSLSILSKLTSPVLCRSSPIFPTLCLGPHLPHSSPAACCFPASPSPAPLAVCGSGARCWPCPPASNPDGCSCSSWLHEQRALLHYVC